MDNRAHSRASVVHRGVVFLSLFLAAEITLPLCNTNPSETNSVELSTTSPSEMGLLPLRKPGKPTLIEQAYIDVYVILTRQSGCSTFFGGPSSVIVLNKLVTQARTVSMGASQASIIRMSGHYTVVDDPQNQISYRLFENVRINLDGAFYKFSSAPSQARVLPIGRMRPGSREARAVALLHELGHLIKRADGQWVLPDDGENAVLSTGNTDTVVERCRQAVIDVTSMQFADEIAQIQ